MENPTSSIEEALGRVYGELRELARRAMRYEPDGHTLQPTALAHEAYLRFRGLYPNDAPNRAWFLATAAHVFRQVLVDHARRKRSERRGNGWHRVTFDPSLLPVDASPVAVLQVHDAVDALAKEHERSARVVEMRFFGGMTVEETAQALGVSVRTVMVDWSFARAWLGRVLAHEEPA